MPGDLKDAVGSGLLAIGCRFRFSGELDDQLLRLDLDARDMGVDEAAVVNRLGRLEVLSNRFDDQRLDLGCRDPADRSGALGCALEQGGRQIVPVLDAALAGMARGHAIAAVIEDAAGQEVPRTSSSWPCDC